MMAAVPYGAMPQDTGEFMLGKVAVTPVFLESNGQVDASTEDWTLEVIRATLEKIREGVDWWTDTLATLHSVHTLQFSFDTTYALNPVQTRYEPISRPSNDFALWVQEFVNGVGFDTPGGLDADMRAFNDAQRQKLKADWAYTMFIVNSEHDADGSFAAGGSFPFAFAFAGGLFLIAPSKRPASTFAHETGHMFWAKDEYPGGSTWSDRRGYYNTQNTNAADNPTQGWVQQPSIMASGDLLDIAFNTHTSPASTLAMVGWQDSDHDGIFDVLDVPLELTGTGYFDSSAGVYKFRGKAKVGVLPNLNSEGLRNDITINRISSIQYRFDNGDWTTYSQPGTYEQDLDLSIPLPAGSQTIEIRAIDAPTGISSNIFHGRLERADAVPAPGINGFVWIDANRNGLRDPGEFGEAGWTVDVLSSDGQALTLRRVIEPDALADGPLIAGLPSGVQITAVGTDTDGRVGVSGGASSSSSSKTFSVYSRASQSWTANWTGASRRMQVEFAAPTSLVEIDAIGTSGESYGRIEAYDAAGNLLERFSTPKLSNGQVVTMRVESPAGTIASVRIGGLANSSVRLDNLRFGPSTRVTTQLKGQYSIPDLPSGDYIVKVTPPDASFYPALSGGAQKPTTVTAGSVTSDADFAFLVTASLWQNPENRLDVNNDHVISALDVLSIVNEINQHGPHPLAGANVPPPFIDVNGDSFSSALDALLIVNFINAHGAGEAEGESTQFVDSLSTAAGQSAARPVAMAAEPELDRAAERLRGAAHDEVLLAMQVDSSQYFDDTRARWTRRPTRLVKPAQS